MSQNLPEDRVRAFLNYTPHDLIDEAAGLRPLTVTDLRDVLAELDAARAEVGRGEHARRELSAELDAARAQFEGAQSALTILGLHLQKQVVFEPTHVTPLDLELESTDAASVLVHIGHPDDAERRIATLGATIDQAHDLAIELIEHAATARKKYLGTVNARQKGTSA